MISPNSNCVRMRQSTDQQISPGQTIETSTSILPANNQLEILSMNREKVVEEMHKNIYYSDKYYDDEYEYRHVVLPRELVKLVPKTHLMSEQEWRGIGVQQSKGWIHYMTHSPEPHILLFKRPITTPPQ